MKPNYGIDAPGVIRNNFIAAAGCFILAYVLYRFAGVPLISYIVPGAFFLLLGLFMLLYSLYGKYRHRERMLALVDWRGDEEVLDVGTGKGLLMIGAARRLRTGKSVGIDIWNKEDLSGNHAAAALHNASLEGVDDKVQVENENAAYMSFPDGSFDVVLSNLCLHNIRDKGERIKACEEIFRVLRPGGVAVISDYKHTKDYADIFAGKGMRVGERVTYRMDTFPWLSIVRAVK